MINIKYLAEKAALNMNSKDALFLVELEGQKKQVSKAVKRQKLNLSLVIDVSGSMSDYIGRSNQFERGVILKNKLFNSQFNGLENFPNNHFNVPSITKIELVKKAAIKAIESLKDGDYVSLVVFSNKAQIIIDAKQVSANSKLEMITKVSGLRAMGGTNLHEGWVTGATEVVKNLKEKYINRVMVLTDGETGIGVTNSKEIAADVAALYKSGITTSTFGVGDSFNENLLQSMTESGGGNFYYIKDEKEFDQMFAEEFTGMANIAGSEIKFTLTLNEGFKVADQMNCFEIKEGVYHLSNVLSESKLSLLFKLDTTYPKKSGEKVVIGELNLEYKDENGNKVNQTVTVELPTTSSKKWEKLEFNQEVKIQETLLIIAKNKLEASAQIAAGNLEGAKGLLRGATGMLNDIGAAYTDSRISASLSTLTNTLNSADTMSAEALKKDIHYQSYKTRTGKDIL